MHASCERHPRQNCAGPQPHLPGAACCRQTPAAAGNGEEEPHQRKLSKVARAVSSRTVCSRSCHLCLPTCSGAAAVSARFKRGNVACFAWHAAVPQSIAFQRNPPCTSAPPVPHRTRSCTENRSMHVVACLYHNVTNPCKQQGGVLRAAGTPTGRHASQQARPPASTGRAPVAFHLP